MASFTAGGSARTPFGKNEFLRSTQDVKYESYTVAASTVALETIDGVAGQKILQSGEVMAKITSGDEAGKIGPFQSGSGAAGAVAVNEVQTVGLGAATAGTVVLTYDGSATAAIAFNATAATVQAALETLPNLSPGDVTVTGGPFPGVVTVTFGGALAGTDVAQITGVGTGLTGGAVAVATTTAGAPAGVLVGAATDGRGDTANIVGINSTFLPWQLMERDVEVAVAYEASVVQGWCFERNVAGLRIALTNTTAAATVGHKSLSLLLS